MANHWGVRFLETSAKECKNVETAFQLMSREIKNSVVVPAPHNNRVLMWDSHNDGKRIDKKKSASTCC